MRTALWYIATRSLGLALLFGPETAVLADPTLWLIELDKLGPGRALPEYPWPSALLAYLPMYLGVPTILHYYAAIVLGNLALDALFAWMLWRAGGRTTSQGMALWLAAFPALGPLWLARLDIVPAVLASGALLASFRARSALAGVLAAAGAGFKLWPAVMLPSLLVPGERPQRLQVLAGFAACALLLAAATVAAVGSWRLWSPLGMQGERGLQIEAFAALPFLWLRFFAGDPAWSVAKDRLCSCQEISGPGVSAAIGLDALALLAAAAALALLYVRAFRAPSHRRTPGLGALLAALGVLAWLITARVLSPQYMIWLAAVLAVMGVLERALLDCQTVAGFVAACALTHLVFPYGYDALVFQHHPLQAPALLVLTARDAIVLLLAVRFARRAWRGTSPREGH